MLSQRLKLKYKTYTSYISDVNIPKTFSKRTVQWIDAFFEDIMDDIFLSLPTSRKYYPTYLDISFPDFVYRHVVKEFSPLKTADYREELQGASFEKRMSIICSDILQVIESMIKVSDSALIFSYFLSEKWSNKEMTYFLFLRSVIEKKSLGFGLKSIMSYDICLNETQVLAILNHIHGGDQFFMSVVLKKLRNLYDDNGRISGTKVLFVATKVFYQLQPSNIHYSKTIEKKTELMPHEDVRWKEYDTHIESKGLPRPSRKVVDVDKPKIGQAPIQHAVKLDTKDYFHISENKNVQATREKTEFEKRKEQLDHEIEIPIPKKPAPRPYFGKKTVHETEHNESNSYSNLNDTLTSPEFVSNEVVKEKYVGTNKLSVESVAGSVSSSPIPSLSEEKQDYFQTEEIIEHKDIYTWNTASEVSLQIIKALKHIVPIAISAKVREVMKRRNLKSLDFPLAVLMTLQKELEILLKDRVWRVVTTTAGIYRGLVHRHEVTCSKTVLPETCFLKDMRHRFRAVVKLAFSRNEVDWKVESYLREYVDYILHSHEIKKEMEPLFTLLVSYATCKLHY